MTHSLPLCLALLLTSADAAGTSKPCPTLQTLIERHGDLAPALITALTDEDQEIRDSAAEALRRLGAEAVPCLLTSLKHEDKRVRVVAAQLLGDVGPKAEAALPQLVKVIKNKAEDKDVRRAAAKALSRIIPSRTPPGNSSPTDELQGWWKGVSSTDDGQKDPESYSQGYTAVFRGDKLTLEAALATAFGAGPGHLAYRVNASKEPKEMTLTSLDKDAKGVVVTCLYKVEDDFLTLAFPKTETKVPQRLTPEKDDGCIIIVFKLQRR